MTHPLRTVALLPLLAAAVASATAQPALTTDRVQLARIAIDRTEVTIAQFARFAQATSTVTRAETEGGGFEFEGGWQ
ncbi:MAG: formylglycine-generating enzyme family protein, partial [Hydrogenophaga sp.]|nr:formylglycine-generating enzyme family protein [Hydrogenophaga sp.]